VSIGPYYSKYAANLQNFLHICKYFLNFSSDFGVDSAFSLAYSFENGPRFLRYSSENGPVKVRKKNDTKKRETEVSLMVINTPCLFYNSTGSIVLNTILHDDQLTILKELNSLILCFNILDSGLFASLTKDCEVSDPQTGATRFTI